MTVAYLPTTEPEPVTGAERTYTSSEVLALTGVTYRQLDHWARSGRLPETAHGSGYSRKFTAAEVFLVQAVLALLSVGFTLDAAFTIARALAEQGRFAATAGRLLITVTVGSEP